MAGTGVILSHLPSLMHSCHQNADFCVNFQQEDHYSIDWTLRCNRKCKGQDPGNEGILPDQQRPEDGYLVTTAFSIPKEPMLHLSLRLHGGTKKRENRTTPRKNSIRERRSCWLSCYSVRRMRMSKLVASPTSALLMNVELAFLWPATLADIIVANCLTSCFNKPEDKE